MAVLGPIDCVVSESDLRADMAVCPERFNHVVKASDEDCYLIELSKKIHIYPENCGLMYVNGVSGDYETEKKRFEEYVCMEFGRKLLELGIIKIYGEPDNQNPKYAILKAKMNCIKSIEQK